MKNWGEIIERKSIARGQINVVGVVTAGCGQKHISADTELELVLVEADSSLVIEEFGKKNTIYVLGARPINSKQQVTVWREGFVYSEKDLFLYTSPKVPLTKPQAKQYMQSTKTLDDLVKLRNDLNKRYRTVC